MTLSSVESYVRPPAVSQNAVAPGSISAGATLATLSKVTPTSAAAPAPIRMR
jgi:hypothetical protein